MFFENARLRKTINYIKLGGKIIPNEFYVLNENGDTLKNKSIYHVTYFNKDTISINEEYNFKIVLEGHLFDSAYLALSDVNEEYPKESVSNPVLEMKNLEGPGLAVNGKHQGWNYIRGRIDNVQTTTSFDKKVKTEVINVYFIDSFYVK